MKKMMLYLAFLFVVPGVVYAGANYALIQAKDVRIVRAADRERVVSPQFYSYRLVWNDNIRKFELREGEWRHPITVEESLPLQLAPEPRTNPRELAI